jgi:AcrR family transcriptional regulator
MQDRRQEVVEVAKTLFAERGIKQTTVREIASSAGIRSGSLYHHFGSKDDIVDFILRDFCAEVLSDYRALARQKVDSAEKLCLFSRYAFSLLDKHSAEIVIVQDDYVDLTKFPQNKDPRYSYLIDFNNEVGKRWLNVFKTGVSTGQFSPSAEPRVLYRLIRDAIIGATRWWEPSKGMTTDQIADSIVEIVLKGILVRP